jgi:hypothetical protein
VAPGVWWTSLSVSFRAAASVVGHRATVALPWAVITRATFTVAPRRARQSSPGVSLVSAGRRRPRWISRRLEPPHASSQAPPKSSEAASSLASTLRARIEN